MSKAILAIGLIAVVAILGYWLYRSMPAPEVLSETEQACIDSGGQISTSSCCISVKDFPNTCLVGACGCSPDNSHQVKVCDCGTDKCFNGTQCAPVNVTDFSKTGNIIKNNPGLKGNVWYLVYEEPGSPALNAELIFDQASQCIIDGKTNPCSSVSLENGERVKIDGQEKDTGVLVTTLTKQD